jgi:hypothetical protein
MNLFALKKHGKTEEAIFCERLDSLFFTQSEMSGRLMPDVTGLIGQYAHGNEPSHHMAYLYDLCDPLKAQMLIQKIKTEFYKNSADGLIGNEDCGQMSSWYVFSSLGFYPVNPYDAYYYCGYPGFENVSIQIPGQKPVTIRTHHEKNANQLSEFKLNGKSESLRFRIKQGDQLDFYLGNSALNRIIHTDQTSNTDYSITPYIKNGQRVFNDSTVVVISSLLSMPIEYCTDTTSKKVNFFNDSLVLRDYTKLFFRQRQMHNKNPWLISEFSPKPEGLILHLDNSYAIHYTAGGNDALIDGLTGSDDYRDGQWQGYQDRDLSLTLEFKEPRAFQTLGIRFIQDQPSWIMMPETVSFWTSEDGAQFELAGKIANPIAQQEDQRIIHEFSFDKNKEKPRIKFVRILAKNSGKLPSWHKGAGGATWLFADEIIIR